MLFQSVLATSGTEIVVGPNPWSSPNDVTSDDPTLGVAAGNHLAFANNVTRTLRGGFVGFSIPITAILKGFVFSHRRQATSPNIIIDFYTSLGISGVNVGDNKASGPRWGDLSPEIQSYGSSSDMWNSGITIADLNSGLVEIDFTASNTFAGISFLTNGWRLDVYYTPTTSFLSVATDA